MALIRNFGTAALLLAGAPALAVTPLQGSIAAIGIVDQGGNGDIQDNQQAISQFTAGFPTISAAPGVYNLAAQATIATAFTTASWDRPDLGLVLLNLSWFSNNGGSGDDTYVAALSGWNYRFQTGSRAVLTANWTYDITGAPDGISDMQIYGNVLNLTINSAGQVSVPLAANSVYDLNVALSGERLGPGGLDQEVNAQGLFNWSITAVPEPASWAMLITGFGLVGAAMRRRRSPAVVAAD